MKPSRLLTDTVVQVVHMNACVSSLYKCARLTKNLSSRPHTQYPPPPPARPKNKAQFPP